MKRVKMLKKQDSRWNITSTHYFSHRFYQVDEAGNFYRDGRLCVVKPDGRGNMFFQLVDDSGIHIRFKAHQIVIQTYNPNGLKDGLSADHKDRNRLDNSLGNLKYSTHKQQSQNRDNVSYKYKKVICLNTSVTYAACNEAEKMLGLVKNTVARVARGERESIHGFKFQFAS